MRITTTLLDRRVLVFVALGGGALISCREQPPKAAPTQASAKLPAPDVTYTADRVRFAPTPIVPAGASAPDQPLVKSLLNVGEQMHYGDQVWNEQRVAPGRPWILVDLAAQTLSVFRDGEEIGRSVTLFGVDGHATPTGRFTILARDKDHISSLYDAPMPYTLRLTNDGVAIHASKVRAGAGTHGCLGIPLTFGAKLYDAMRVGDQVIILANSKPKLVPAASAHGKNAKVVV